jgi:hypothetical protein
MIKIHDDPSFTPSVLDQLPEVTKSSFQVSADAPATATVVYKLPPDGPIVFVGEQGKFVARRAGVHLAVVRLPVSHALRLDWRSKPVSQGVVVSVDVSAPGQNSSSAFGALVTDGGGRQAILKATALGPKQSPARGKP